MLAFWWILLCTSDICSLPEKESEQKTHRRVGILGEAKWPLFHRNVWESRWQNSVCLRFLCVVLVTRFHPGWSSSCPHILASILHQSPTACEPPPPLCYVSLIFCYIGSRFHFWTAVIRYTTTCHACGSFLNFLSLDKYILRTFQHLVQY